MKNLVKEILETKDLPNSLVKQPLLDTFIEFRFEKVNFDKLFSEIYTLFSEEYQEVEEFSVMQVPKEFRETDESFNFLPYKAIKNKDRAILVGKDILVFSVENYPLWKNLRKEFKNFLIKIDKNCEIKKILKITLRNINFFENQKEDIFNVNLFFKDQIISELISSNIKMVINIEKNINSLIRFISDAQVKINEESEEISEGKILDIDVCFEECFEFELNSCIDTIERLHEISKNIFFTLLK